MFEKNRDKVLQFLKGLNGCLYLKGETLKHRMYTDVELPFRQESFFYYMTGCDLPNSHFIQNLKTKECFLYFEELESDYGLWHGAAPALEELSKKYNIKCFRKAPDFSNYETIHVLEKEVLNRDNVSFEYLKNAIINARLTKTSDEISLMRKAAEISAKAHVSLMKKVQPGVGSEKTLLSFFENECAQSGYNFSKLRSLCSSLSWNYLCWKKMRNFARIASGYPITKRSKPTSFGRRWLRV
jgi:Xaa-Pro dipeptidase